MSLETQHPRNLNLTDDTHTSVRVIPPHSSHWKPPPENKATSGAFDDKNGEVSIDILVDYPAVQELNERYGPKIQSNGIGLACAGVSNVRAALLSKQIVGNVWNDPIPENELHGIITGKQNRSKKEILRDTFKIEVAPKSPQEVFGT